jgi:hypothetical protein
MDNYAVAEISQALGIACSIYENDNFIEETRDVVREELETTILGLIKSLRISAFHASEKK